MQLDTLMVEPVFFQPLIFIAKSAKINCFYLCPMLSILTL